MMRRFYLQALFAFMLFTLMVVAISVSRPTRAETGEPKKVVLVTIDGLRPDFYLSELFNAPTLKTIKEARAHATSVVPVFPTVTYPNHTSLITGVYSHRHGILSNTVFDWVKGPLAAWYWESNLVQAPSLHDYLHQAGRPSASVRWPVTLMASNITYNVPEIFGVNGYYEGSVFDLTVKYTESSLLNELIANTTLKRFDDEAEIDFWVAEAAAHLIKSKRPDFITIHLANVDHVQHGYGPGAEEVRAAVEAADSNINVIRNAVDLDNTCFIVTGDHGFRDVSKRINLNVLFAQKGWLTLDKNGKIKTFKVVAHSSGGQAAIYTKDERLGGEIRKVLIANQNLGFKIIEKRKLRKLGAYGKAILAVEGKNGSILSNTATGAVLTDTGSLKGQHGYLPDHPELHTGFVAQGCGISEKKNLGLIRLIDIAPTIAQALRIQASGFDGQPINLWQ